MKGQPRDAGRRAQQEAAVAYHKAVLSAWHDIVNTLTAYKTEQVRRRAPEGANRACQAGAGSGALALRAGRRRHHDAAYRRARPCSPPRQQLAQSQTNVSIDLIALFKALGGGWEETYPDARARSRRLCSLRQQRRCRRSPRCRECRPSLRPRSSPTRTDQAAVPASRLCPTALSRSTQPAHPRRQLPLCAGRGSGNR